MVARWLGGRPERTGGRPASPARTGRGWPAAHVVGRPGLMQPDGSAAAFSAGSPTPIELPSTLPCRGQRAIAVAGVRDEGCTGPEV